VKNKLRNLVSPLINNREKYFLKKRKALCNRIIYGHSLIAAGFGLIPLVDAVMATILTKNMVYLLQAMWGNPNFVSPHILSGIISGSVTTTKIGYLSYRILNILRAIETARVAFTIGTVTSKIFEGAIITFLIGQAISVTVNGSFVIAVGELNYKLLKDHKEEEKPQDQGPLVFGRPLEDVCRGSGTNIPPIVTDCLNYLMENEVYRNEGIFRTNGNYDLKNQIKEKYDKGEVFNISEVTDWEIVTDLLKHYNRELPETPFQKNLVLKINATDTIDDFHERAETLSIILSELPIYNLTYLKDFFSFS